MRTIKRYFFIQISILLLIACGGGDGGNTEHSSLNPGGDNGGGSPQSYKQSVTISAQGGEQTVTLNNLSSSISSVGSTDSWLVVVPQYYTSGSPTVKLEVEENKTTSERKCDVTIIASSGDKVVLTVTQSAGEANNNIDDIHNENTDQPAYAPRH